MRRRGNRRVIRFSRDYRRAKKFDMGLPKAQKKRRKFVGIGEVRIKVFVVAIIVLAAFMPAVDLLSGVKSSDGRCQVVRLIDGDTASLYCPGRGVIRARFLGYDTPERSDPGCFREWIWAVQATMHLRKLIFKADQVQISLHGLDAYGRSLAEMRLDGVSVDKLMIQDRYARPYSGGRRIGWCG